MQNLNHPVENHVLFDALDVAVHLIRHLVRARRKRVRRATRTDVAAEGFGHEQIVLEFLAGPDV
jgi:hypothetical protein